MSRQVEFKLFMARYLAKAVRAVATHGLQGVVRAWSIRMSRQVEFKLFTARHFDELLQVVPISRLIGTNGHDADKKAPPVSRRCSLDQWLETRDKLLRWHSRDRFEDAAGDLVRIALAVRTTVFEVALPTVVLEAVRHADGGATVGDAP